MSTCPDEGHALSGHRYSRWLAVAVLTLLTGFSPPVSSLSTRTVTAPPLAPAGARAPQSRGQELRFGTGLTLPDLVGRADVIVTGEVVGLEPSWNAERSDIFTTVVLRVERPLKGSASGDVRFRIPGGAVGEDWVWVTHAPRFEIGERALVFLRFGGPRLPTVVGMEAGKKRVVAADGGHELILPELHWEDRDEGASVVLTTVGELAEALPRIEAQSRSPSRNSERP